MCVYVVSIINIVVGPIALRAYGTRGSCTYVNRHVREPGTCIGCTYVYCHVREPGVASLQTKLSNQERIVLGELRRVMVVVDYQ